MKDILSNAVYLYSISKNGLIASVMRPWFPLFFLIYFSIFKIIFINQRFMRKMKIIGFGKYFPLKTVMGPCGLITHCYIH